MKTKLLKRGKWGFLCPKCNHFDTFQSRDSDGNVWLYCNKCGFEGKIIGGCWIEVEEE